MGERPIVPRPFSTNADRNRRHVAVFVILIWATSVSRLGQPALTGPRINLRMQGPSSTSGIRHRPTVFCNRQMISTSGEKLQRGCFPEENQNKLQQHSDRGGKNKPMQGWCGINEANERKKEREKERRCLLFASRLWRRAYCIPRGAAIWWELATWSVSLTPDDNT